MYAADHSSLKHDQEAEDRDGDQDWHKNTGLQKVKGGIGI